MYAFSDLLMRDTETIGSLKQSNQPAGKSSQLECDGRSSWREIPILVDLALSTVVIPSQPQIFMFAYINEFVLPAADDVVEDNLALLVPTYSKSCRS